MAVKGVDTRHPQYDTYAPQWKRCRDVVAGSDTIKGKDAKSYLPALMDQEKDDYKRYLMRAPFVNFTWRTLQGFQGMLFRKDPVIVAPAGAEGYLKNINRQGLSLGNLIEACTLEIETTGRICLLVDYSPMIAKPDGTLPTKAEVEALGHRPKIVSYPTESVINWAHREINGEWVLSFVVLYEEGEEPKAGSEFERQVKKRWRVLDLDPLTNTYRQRVFKKLDVPASDGDFEQEGDDIVPLMNGEPLTEIPFYSLGPDGLEMCLSEPPMIDLVDLNLNHYRTSADYEHAAHMTALPTPYITGWEDRRNERTGELDNPKIYIGSLSAWLIQNPNSQVGFLEYTGQGLNPLKEKLEGLKEDMAALGARMIAGEKAGVEAFKTLAMRNAGETSILASIANATSEGFTKALQMFCRWAGMEADDETCKVTINRDFMPVPLDSATLTALVSAWQSGALSEGELFTLLQRGDAIEASKTLEEHQAEIDSNPPLAKLAGEASIEAMLNPPDNDEKDDEEEAA